MAVLTRVLAQILERYRDRAARLREPYDRSLYIPTLAGVQR
jgi:hypothetical protein